MASTRVPLRDSGCVLHISYVISLRKLASTRVPLERLREAWRPPFKKFLAHPASPLGRFFSGLRLQTDAFSRHPASPLGRSLWATV
ncbi:hypothetical protein Prudu_226S000100 [Prunus dulcis]|uniref:Uncharacterized protein n=1 Tax=Prunus dulcis TaxID=3755 RepID=A0A5H2XND0_PRUDU|nr:hypothetical protein Prudu_226S000100 [Prunus dulcis]